MSWLTDVRLEPGGNPARIEHAAGMIVQVQPDDGRIAGESGGGAVLQPLFVDAHCHILPTGLDLKKLNLSGIADRAAVLDAVRDRHRQMPPDAWLHAVHYDQTRFADAAHLTSAELDAISSDRPILLRHSNGHASVANSAALRAAKVPLDVKDPDGGSYVRDAGGNLTGVLLERAHEHVTAASPAPSRAEMVEAIIAAGERMRAVGVGAATDMMTGRWSLEDELNAYREASESGCPIRLRLCLQWGQVFGPRAMPAGQLRETLAAMKPDLCRAVGIKIFADGAIGSATAAIYGRYATGDLTFQPGTPERSGQLIYSPSRLADMVRTAHEAGWMVAVHSIGDWSTDVVLDAFETTGDPGRHRLEHAMLLSDAQIGRIARLGCHVTMQPEFLLRFGHAYLKQLGPGRAHKLKRAASVLAAGIPLSFSSDRPIVPGDPMDGIRTAVARPEWADPAENLDETTARRLYTEGGALANGDQNLMGRLAPGFVADWIFDPTPARLA